MIAKKINETADLHERPADRKAYDTPELKQLGTLEELTRWGASVSVGE